jgi:hypothetical protein
LAIGPAIARNFNAAPHAGDRGERTSAASFWRGRYRGAALMPEDAPDSEFERFGKVGVRGLRMMSIGRGSHVPHLDADIAARATALYDFA